jgi:hypothetical protein
MSMIRHDDRGASAITIAFMMVLFMGIAAIAVDLGLGFNERRVDQTGADTGVMAGAVELVLGGSYQDTVDEVLAYVNDNIRPVPLTDWAIGNCEDPDHLITTAASLGLTPATECISWEGLQKIRVQVPNQDTDTAFSQFVGVDSLTTNAEAEALAIQFPGAGNTPPFIALAGSAGGDLICLRTGPSGQPNPPPLMTGNGEGVDASLGTDPDPCDESEYDPDSEFFGALDPYVYFNNATGAVTCKSNLVEYAIASGMDHTLSRFDPAFVVGSTNPTGSSVVQDDCAPVPVAGVNTIPLKTGLSASELRCGMLTTNAGGCSSSVSPGAAGGNNVPARLHLGPYVQSSFTFLGERMDNKPLWDFLATPLGTWPGACTTLSANVGNPDWDYFDKKDQLIDCLSAWSDGDGTLFTDGIIETPRFAWIPILAESNLDTEPSVCPEGGGGCVHFNDFVPVYMQTLYTLITGGGGGGACDDVDRGASGNPRWGRHDAGESIDCGKNNGNLDRISAVVLDCGMLSGDVCDARPGTPGGDVDPILELTK